MDTQRFPGKSGVDLVKSEKGRFDAGKFENDIDKISGTFETVKSKAGDSQVLLGKIGDLQQRKDELLPRIKADQALEKVSAIEPAALSKEVEDVMGALKKLRSDIG